jgi:hypothetical protein
MFNVLTLITSVITLIGLFVLNSYYSFVNSVTMVSLVIVGLLILYIVVRSRGVKSLDGNCYIVHSDAHVYEVYGISCNEFGVKFTIKDNELVASNDDVNYIDMSIKFCDMSSVSNIDVVHISGNYCYAISAMNIDICRDDRKLQIDMLNAEKYDIKLAYDDKCTAVTDIMNVAIKEYLLLKFGHKILQNNNEKLGWIDWLFDIISWWYNPSYWQI